MRHEWIKTDYRLIFNGDTTPTYAAAAHVDFGESGLNPDDTL